jgi:hypothetical protein
MKGSASRLGRVFGGLLLFACLTSSLLVPAEASSTLRNLTLNGGFEATSTGSSSFNGINSGGHSAAPHWLVWNNTSGLTTTDLEPSTAPLGGTTMLHVTTNGLNNGIYQVFSPGSGPATGQANVWVYVVTGVVGVGTGNTSTLSTNGFSTTTGQWEQLRAPQASIPVEEIIIYSAVDGPVEFFVDNARVLTPT